MRVKSFFIVSLVATAFLATACNNDDANEPAVGGEASITITLEGEKIGGRATDPTADDATDERKIVNYKVYVFNATSGAVEKVVNGIVNSGIAGVTKITGLNTLGAKKVVVLANVPTGYPAISHYSDFSNNMFNLDLQTPANRGTTGLVMSGESTDFSLSNADTETTPKGIAVTISRVVAKVELASIEINPTAGRAGVFLLTSVSIQKAKSRATVGPVNVVSDIPYYGGLMGNESQTTVGYLIDPFTSTPANGVILPCDNYFYVFPNAVDGEETLLTIAGTYDGVPTYFPFRINRVAGEGGGSADGSMIKRNTRYVLAVNLKNLGGGSTDPDLPGDPAAIEVTVTTEGWEGPLTQNVEW